MLTPVYAAHLRYSPLPWRFFWILLLISMTYVMLTSLKVMIGIGLRKHATWYVNRCRKRKHHLHFDWFKTIKMDIIRKFCCIHWVLPVIHFTWWGKYQSMRNIGNNRSDFFVRQVAGCNIWYGSQLPKSMLSSLHTGALLLHVHGSSLQFCREWSLAGFRELLFIPRFQ